MLSASLYIVVCSARNHVRQRLRRLREPRYLIGAIAGAAYLYFAVFLRMGGARRPNRRGRAAAALPIVAASVWPPLAACGLLLLFALAWLAPSASGLFEFSRAEVQWLVPAPVSRRQLLIHRLLRSQLGLLFAAMVPVLLISGQASPMTAMGAPWTRILRGLALWVIFVTVRVYFAGVTEARARLGASDTRMRAVAWAPLVVTAAVVATIFAPLAGAFWWQPAVSLNDVATRFSAVVDSGWPRIALWPFLVLVRPVFFDGLASYALSILGAVVVMVAASAWVVRSDEVYQGVHDYTANRDERQTSGTASMPRVRTTRWRLALTGRPETLFAWKNAMQTLRTTNLITMIPYVFPAIGLAVIGMTIRMSATGARTLAVALAMGSLSLALFAAVLGPQTIRSDLRGDLRHLEVIKTWPVKSSALIRGEILWPTLYLTAVAWSALACATVFSAAAFPELSLAWRLSASAAAFVVAPVLICAQITVHNTAAVLFPAWVATGGQRPRGLDMMGQRLILFAAVLLALVLVVGPGAIAGGLVAFAFSRLIGAFVLVPAALACVVVVALEILLVTELLGAAYDRIDLSQVERAE